MNFLPVLATPNVTSRELYITKLENLTLKKYQTIKHLHLIRRIKFKRIQIKRNSKNNT